MRRIIVCLTALAMVLVLGVASASANRLEDVKERGTLVCGVKDAVVPFGFVDEQTSQLVGFDIDICKYIADEMGVKLELKPVTSATRIPMVAQGSIDIAAATMTHKQARGRADRLLHHLFHGRPEDPGEEGWRHQVRGGPQGQEGRHLQGFHLGKEHEGRPARVHRAVL